jgi:ABC-type sulfate transport system permease subunit
LVGLITAIIVNLTFGLTVLAIARQQSLLGESLSPFVAPLLLSLFFLVLFGLPAYLLEYNRLYLVAVMFALPELLRTAFQELWGINLGFVAREIPAAVVITVGLVTFLRFLREHPVPAIPAGEKDERCETAR